MESDLIDRSEVLPVLSVHMPVLAATDIVVTKLMALDEHYCDFSRLLPVARALREQVDWADVRREVADNDFAVVFLAAARPARRGAPLRSRLTARRSGRNAAAGPRDRPLTCPASGAVPPSSPGPVPDS